MFILTYYQLFYNPDNIKKNSFNLNDQCKNIDNILIENRKKIINNDITKYSFQLKKKFNNFLKFNPKVYDLKNKSLLNEINLENQNINDNIDSYKNNDNNEDYLSMISFNSYEDIIMDNTSNYDESDIIITNEKKLKKDTRYKKYSYLNYSFYNIK